MTEQTIDKESVTSIVLACLRQLAKFMDIPSLENPTDETPLYGPGGYLKSLALVNLISDIEEKIHETFSKEIVLANERALSQTRSPFTTVETLSNYILELLDADSHG